MSKIIKVKPESTCKCKKPSLQLPINIHDICYCKNCGSLLTIDHKDIDFLPDKMSKLFKK